MIDLPLPPRLAAHLRNPAHSAHPSLVLARGANRWAWGANGTGAWTKARPKERIPDGKTLFFRDFATWFASAQAQERYDEWTERRRRALEARGAVSIEAVTAGRLVIGLGLAHPADTGFLLDRMTGCPYVPGSSVKGVLRHAARLAAAGELGEPDQGTFWRKHLTTVFGSLPTTTDPDEPQAQAWVGRGEGIFHDAFPVSWPTLELDVLTPHYGAYYREEAPYPGDWENPVPVTFLTLAAGTRLRFFLACRGRRLPAATVLPATRELLELALSWLGLGGKTAAGYGFFEEATPGKAGGAGVEEVWPEVALRWRANIGRVEATYEGRTADAAGGDLWEGWSKARIKKLKDSRLVASVVIRERERGGVELLRVL